jgi:hypothetical protein
MADWGIAFWLIGLTAITFFAIAWLLDINNRQRELQNRLEQTFTDSEGLNLSEPLQALTARLDLNETHMAELREALNQLADNVPQGTQAVGLVRFQAFSDYGGDQSFALALANAAGNGVVLSGIFAREGTRVYAKPLDEWTSTYSLSFEEEEAIDKAQSQLQEASTGDVSAR